MKIWTHSIREEIIGALWLIAGLLAWNDGIKWLAWILFVKATFDTFASICFAVVETSLLRKKLKKGGENG